jgi:DNA-nicking Smr family endonuclease
LPDEGLMPNATSASTQKKRRRQEARLFAVTNNPELARLSDRLASDAIRNQSWWESTNAFSLFGELRIDEDDEVPWNARAMAEKRISRLRRGRTTADSWKLALNDLDARNICSAHDAFMK